MEAREKSRVRLAITGIQNMFGVTEIPLPTLTPMCSFLFDRYLALKVNLNIIYSSAQNEPSQKYRFDYSA